MGDWIVLNPDKTVAYFTAKLGAYAPTEEPLIREAVRRINEKFPEAIGRISRIQTAGRIAFTASGLNYECATSPIIFYFCIAENDKYSNPPFAYNQGTGEMFLDKPMTRARICFREKESTSKKKGQQIAEKQQVAEENEPQPDGMIVNRGSHSGGMF